nr:unnamed protein product [Callosobruchus chinensis]
MEKRFLSQFGDLLVMSRIRLRRMTDWVPKLFTVKKPFENQKCLPALDNLNPPHHLERNTLEEGSATLLRYSKDPLEHHKHIELPSSSTCTLLQYDWTMGLALHQICGPMLLIPMYTLHISQNLYKWTSSKSTENNVSSQQSSPFPYKSLPKLRSNIESRLFCNQGYV